MKKIFVRLIGGVLLLTLAGCNTAARLPSPSDKAAELDAKNRDTQKMMSDTAVSGEEEDDVTGIPPVISAPEQSDGM